MDTIKISQVRVDSNGMAAVTPDPSGDWKSFSMIYRDASFVRWNEAASEFYIDPTGSFDITNSFVRICNAAKNEYGTTLEITDETIFVGIDARNRDSIRTSGQIT